MKFRRLSAAVLALMMLLSSLTVVISSAQAADDRYVYATVEGKSILTNWGTRGETAEELSPNALLYYVEGAAFSVLSTNAGGSSKSDAPASALYGALRDLMVERHTYINNYQETRPWYAYTDCEGNDTSKFSSFYSGQLHSSVWDGGYTWNREHTWPKSKGLGGDDVNDIMMLRPTTTSENSSRGNKAYGEGSGYFDPGTGVRGDCARIALYVYTRWGNTGLMWGKSGMFESLEILLKWMAEDPVDTWEMGRNDVVESITGVRNVFVDYPEYAWLLFGQAYPAGLTTPSGEGKTQGGTATPPAVDPVSATVTYYTVIGKHSHISEDRGTVGGELIMPKTKWLGSMPEGLELPEDCRFVGWSLTEIEKTTTPTDVVAVGEAFVIPQARTELYAVWSYTARGVTYYAHDPLSAAQEEGCQSSLTVVALPCLSLGLAALWLRKKERG